MESLLEQCNKKLNKKLVILLYSKFIIKIAKVVHIYTTDNSKVSDTYSC